MSTNIGNINRGTTTRQTQQTTRQESSSSASLWDSFTGTVKGAASDAYDLGRSVFGYAKKGAETAYDYAKKGAEAVYDYAKTDVERSALQVAARTKHVGLPVAGELLDLSLMSPKNRDAQVKLEGGQVLNSAQSRAKLNELGLKEGDNCHTQPDQMDLPTMVMGKDSKVTKAVNGNEAMQNIVRNWANNGAKDKAVLPFNTANANSFDLRMGIGYGQIVGLHKTDDGYAEGYVEDVYDYDKHYNKGKDDGGSLKSGMIEVANDIAVDVQNSGQLHNYRTLIPIRVKL